MRKPEVMGCYKNICERCVNRNKNKKVMFSSRPACLLGKKPTKNSCFYFKCEGKGSAKCESCKRFYDYTDWSL